MISQFFVAFSQNFNFTDIHESTHFFNQNLWHNSTQAFQHLWHSNSKKKNIAWSTRIHCEPWKRTCLERLVFKSMAFIIVTMKLTQIDDNILERSMHQWNHQSMTCDQFWHVHYNLPVCTLGVSPSLVSRYCEGQNWSCPESVL